MKKKKKKHTHTHTQQQPLVCKKTKGAKTLYKPIKKKKTLYKLKSNNNTSMPTLKSTLMRYYQRQLLKIDIDTCLSTLTIGLTSMLFLKLKILKNKNKGKKSSNILELQQ